MNKSQLEREIVKQIGVTNLHNPVEETPIKVLVATNNKGKLAEIQKHLTFGEIYSLKDAGIDIDPEENGETFFENARIKVDAIRDYLIENPVDGFSPKEILILSDDSGILVDALPDKMGIYSARLSGDTNKETRDDSNNSELLRLMENVPYEERTGRYVTCLVVLLHDQCHIKAYGTSEIIVAEEEVKNNGFAYDYVTIDVESGKYYSELSSEDKINISSRGNALRGLKHIIGSIQLSNPITMNEFMLQGEMKFSK